MKIKLLLVLLVIIGLGAVVWWKQSNKILPPNSSIGTATSQTENSQQKDVDAIRFSMGEPNLELAFVNADLPTPYFRVGKVTKVGNGENMDAVDGWTRKVNIYDQKKLVNGECSVYEFNIDARNHNLTAVIIRDLRQGEIEDLKNSGTTCNSNPVNNQKITKAEAETIAMNYLKRALSNFDQIKDQFVYSQQQDGTHEWLWEDKGYKLPEGLSSRPYPSPTIRISVYGNSQIQYWNTTSLFAN